MIKSRFIIVEHDAKKARLHWDLRFRMPNSKNWVSFAVRKGIPIDPGKKVLAVRTHDHTEKEALYLGTIKDGYGAGTLKKWDDGDCIVHKFGPGHILVEFKGKKIKGLYHFISTGVVDKSQYKLKQYMLFKGKLLNERTGMISRVPDLWGDEVEEGEDEDYSEKLPWSNVNKTIGKKLKGME